MSRVIPDHEPARFVAGETLRWTKSLADFSAADGWQLDYHFRSAAGVGFDAAATADGSSWAVTVAAATTTPLGAGDLTWQAWVSKAGEKYLVDDGTSVVEASLATASAETAVDTRSRAKRILDAIDAMIEGKATLDQQEYVIDTGAGSRSLKRIPIPDLILLRKTYAQLYGRELRGAGRRRGGRAFKTYLAEFKGA
ncbi:MAG TPA: hypothetical protein VF508_01975 [Pyrinomonadaceae bacterium]|jgi:hypothetical protein